MEGANGKAVFLTGNSNPALAVKICSILGEEVMKPASRFSDGEVKVAINESVRGMDAFVIQPTCCSVNDSLMELLIIIDALKGSSARRITAVLPYYGYARQDKKKASGEPRTASMVARLIESAGPSRILLMDLHSDQIQSFFSIPVDHIFASPVIIEYIRKNFPGNEYVLVSPDTGGAERTEFFANHLGKDMALIDKRREITKANEVKKMKIVGDVRGRKVIMIDDMIDTFGTMDKAIDLLLDEGKAEEVHICAVHPVLSGPAVSRIERSRAKSVVVTDSIPLSDYATTSSQIHVISVSELLAETIRRINNNESLRSMFQ